MRRDILVILCVVLLSAFVHGHVGHKLRTVAQGDETLYEVMIFVDAMSFTGGGATGYDNYFVWEYAVWRSSPDRSWTEKFLFWDVGLSSPPEEYPYPPHFDQPWFEGVGGAMRNGQVPSPRAGAHCSRPFRLRMINLLHYHASVVM